MFGRILHCLDGIDKLSKYFHTSQPDMAEPHDAPPPNNNTSTTAPNKITKRKLSFMNPFTSRQNSESSIQSPTQETGSITDSPRQRKSVVTKEQSGLVSDSDPDFGFHEFTMDVIHLEPIRLRNPGLTDMMETVGTAYTKAKPKLKTMCKCTLNLNTDGINIKQDDHTGSSTVPSRNTSHDGDGITPATATDLECLYKVRRMLYCAVDKTHQKVFFFNYQYGSRAENVDLHMIVCKNPKDAKELAKRVSQLFKKIQIEQHKRDKEKREDHIQSVHRIRTRSNQNITSSSASSTTGSKDGSCSGTYGSKGSAGEWSVQDRIQLSMA
ncbi:uncharacterized protein [Clytia hemisphaerica]|uniref:uncharacterized protein isoform X2 n=1 Tax=Clytia hemisphaerica TaxID=252671 RepID=UPI0034D46A9C